MKSIFIINCSFLLFLGRFCGGEGGIKIAIYQLIRGVGDCRARVLCRSIRGNSGKTVGERGVVESNCIVNFSFFRGGLWWCLG